MSLQVCHCCGWSKVTSYQGLRIHQGKMGCTPNGMHQQQNLCGQTVQSNVMLDFGFCVETDIVDSPDLSLQVCHCGWTKMTTYRGLRIHQGRMGCTVKGMRVTEHQQEYLCNQTVQSNVMLDFGFCVKTENLDSPDLSLQVCHCGWTKRTTYRGLRIHQGRMGCTEKGARIPKKESYDSKYNREEREHQRRPPAENIPEGLRRSSRKSSAAAKIMDSFPEPPRSAQRANPARYLEAAQVLTQNGVSEEMRISPRIKREPGSFPEAPVRRTVERAPELQRQDFGSDLQVQNPFREPLVNPESQLQERCRSQQVDRAVRSPKHVVRSKNRVALSEKKNPPVIHPKNREPPVVLPEDKAVLPKNRDSPEIRPSNRDAPLVLPKNRVPPVVPTKNRVPPVVPTKKRIPPVVPTKKRIPPVAPPKNRDSPEIRPSNRDALLVLPKNRVPPVVPTKKRIAPVALPENRDPPVQEEKRPHPVLVEEHERELEASTKDSAAEELETSVKMVVKGNQSASRTSLRKLANLSADQENRSPHPLIKTEIESSSFTAKLKEFERISVGAGAQPTFRVKQESVTDNTAATRSSTSSIQDPALFSEVDFSVGMKVKDLARMFSGSSDKKISNKKGKPKEEPQPSQNVKETTNTEESSQVKVSQEVPLTSEQPAFITGMKVKELLQVFPSLDSKTSKKEQQLFEVKICRISFATKEETKTNREEHNEVKTFGDVVTAVSKATEERKPTKTLKVKELVQMFSASSVPPKEKLETNRRTSSEPAPVRRGRK